MKKRYLSINTVIRKNQLEATRDEHIMEDETELHTAQAVMDFSDAVRKGIQDAKITWALSWQALTDQSDRYKEIRETVKKIHIKYGDDVTFIPGGYFANVYNSREQINKDISDALKIIANFMDGYRPKSLVAGFLSSSNIQYAREKEGIIAVQGNVWSQYSIDGQDGDGSIAYPYYPSMQHFCKPAQNREDFIDCINFDGWTVDFIAGRLNGDFWNGDERFCSRMGVGPLETLETFGIEKGLKQMKYTTNVHFCDENVCDNPFSWVTNNYEIGEMNKFQPKGGLIGFTQWLSWIKKTWPDVECPTIAEFAKEIREEYKDNNSLSYRFYENGSGIGASYQDEEIVWIMKKNFRLGLLKKDNIVNVIDFTEYSKDYTEPQKIGERNWTLFGEINQKQTRPQDKPILLNEFAKWAEIEKMLNDQERSFIKNYLK
jgi:hypothetical protein